MKIIQARNVHQALPKAVHLLQQYGVDRNSRVGPVKCAPWPVATVYEHPQERVVFWPQRDANPAFHLYESLWMLAGRHDLAPLLRYVKDFGKFSDDGKTLSSAYGYEWRRAHDEDQLIVIAQRLRADPDDRRCVLSMWDPAYHLGADWKDVPCNTTAVFQRSLEGCLDLTVFCRSNDIVWGAYGANAVHFSVLQEYMATWIGCPIGRYTQVSVNWHAYPETLRPIEQLSREVTRGLYAVPTPIIDPYCSGEVHVLPFARAGEPGDRTIQRLDRQIEWLLLCADDGFRTPLQADADQWFTMAYAVLRAHEHWRMLTAPERYDRALETLQIADPRADFIVAMRQWIERRYAVWEAKMAQERTTHGG